jgi:hypothetical protein
MIDPPGLMKITNDTPLRPKEWTKATGLRCAQQQRTSFAAAAHEDAAEYFVNSKIINFRYATPQQVNRETGWSAHNG